MNRNSLRPLAVCLLAAMSSTAWAQLCRSTGADVIVGELTGPANYVPAAPTPTRDAFSVGTFSCNIGDFWLNWIASTNQHPVIGQNLFKMKTDAGVTRFEHIGQGWLKHGFFALSQELCCTNCEATDGTHLGVHCADPYTAERNGSQSNLGPKWQVNAWTGEFPYPPANPSFVGTVPRRLQARLSDLEASSPSVRYFVEGQYVVSDELVENRFNNCSYRQATMVANGVHYNMGYTGPTVRTKAGIQAWKTLDPTVTEIDVRVPGEGQFLLAAKATDLGNGSWNYEYALQNVNSDRSGRAFSLPIPAGFTVTNIGFHDVAYHSGDGPGDANYDGTDWASTVGGGTIRWATDSFDQNSAANALRWGTLYNFRFDATAPPAIGDATIELFKPGTPTSVTIAGVPLPAGAACPGDVNGDNAVDLGDLSILLANYGASGATREMGDLSGDGNVDLTDLSALLTVFGATCP
jgi:Dockerin type I domain